MFGILPEPEINSYFKGFLVCQNLIHLELYFYIFHHMDNVVEWDNVVVVLENCPKLQILVIEKVSCICRLFLFLSLFECLFFKSYFGICFAVDSRQRFVMEISKFCSGMHFVSPQIMFSTLQGTRR